MAEASSPTRDSPASTLKIAETSGMAAAMTEPNMNSSRTSAHTSPMTSDFRSWVD